MWNWIKLKLVRSKRPVVRSYWWVASAPYMELPPLANDPRFELRINKHNISEQRVPNV